MADEEWMVGYPEATWDEINTLQAQRDALLAALDTISGAAWVLPDPELNRITIDAIKTEADRAIAAVKQEGDQ